MSNRCKSCGASIFWVETGSGSRMPLDSKAEKRLVVSRNRQRAKVVDTYVSHFATCPDASKHRKKEKADEQR